MPRLPVCTLLAVVCAADFVPAPLRAALSADEQKLVSAVDATQDDFARELAAAVQIDSATENLAGVRRMGEHFRDEFAALGFNSRFIPLPAETRRAGHLVAEHPGTTGKRVLLIGHLDTVYPGANFRQDGDHVSGAGVGDMKGGDVVILEALRALQRTGFLADTQIIVVMTGDEEAVGDPVEITRRDLREAAARSDVALAFESAIGNTGTIARRGTAGWELNVEGVTGHSSGIFSEEMGAGAVYEAARVLTGFYEAARKIDGITLNPALIAGGADVAMARTGGTVAGKTNIIARQTIARGDIRFLSEAQLQQMEAAMHEVVEHALPKTKATLTIHHGYPPMEATDANRALLRELDRASRDLGYAAITAYDPRARGAGDVAFVSPPLPGLDGLGLGGHGEHTPKESAEITRAPELIKRTALLIYRLTR